MGYVTLALGTSGPNALLQAESCNTTTILSNAIRVSHTNRETLALGLHIDVENIGEMGGAHIVTVFTTTPLPAGRFALEHMADYKRNEEHIAAAFQDDEAAPMDKKYGGLVPKKKPLISKAVKMQDHERSFFDSADWALSKQGAGVNQQSTVAIETLRPKLQRTPHQQLPPRRPACTS
ncbi:hypothetical protein Pfo_015897 [Paulownia fortunei]|nr:hypothetical protein Pfo_015897 [Paulownia fortunei]